MPKRLLVVFVHGWSVTTTGTYGGLPRRLAAEAALRGYSLEITDIALGEYVSFHDEVRLPDLSRAFAEALDDTLAAHLAKGRRFVCITHSTGGPVIRDWFQRYHPASGAKPRCPMSHLIMLAPANHGSALAQLGKGRVSRLKSWFAGIEPGQGVLDWLEMGSRGAWELNRDWIAHGQQWVKHHQTFPFVLTGQTIDRAFYDNLNSYTGEMGSDGVVRAAAANLHATYIRLEQDEIVPEPSGKLPVANALRFRTAARSLPSPMRIIAGKSHSGSDLGIMNSVSGKAGAKSDAETVDAIFDCLAVQDDEDYGNVVEEFSRQTTIVQERERLEVESRFFRTDALFFHDRCSMVVFRVIDDAGNAVKDYDLLLTAGPKGDPNHLPHGFFIDRQRNKLNQEVVTYYLNYDIMHGVAAVRDQDGRIVRAEIHGADMLGLRLYPRPDAGFCHYLPCTISASKELLQKALKPNATTLIEIVVRRIVHKNAFRLMTMDPSTKAKSFKNVNPGDELVPD